MTVQTNPTTARVIPAFYRVTIDHPAIGRATVKVFANSKREAGEFALSFVRKDKGIPTLSAIPKVEQIPNEIGASA